MYCPTRLDHSLSSQRKKTLLLEYRSRHKTGKFVDQRFGEYDENLSVEEKVALRFLMEKKKVHVYTGRVILKHGCFSIDETVVFVSSFTMSTEAP